MICPKCKNPIADNAAECEWCGMSFAVIRNEKQAEEAKINDLDAKLNSLLMQGQKSQALELYKERTGANGRYHVGRLNFFLQHEHATGNTWRNYAIKSTIKYILIKFLQGVLLCFALLFMGVGVYVIIENDSVRRDLGGVKNAVSILIFSIIVISLLIYWIYKTRKLKI